MYAIGKRLFGFLCTVLLLSRTVLGVAKFVNPKGPDGTVTLTLGEKFLVSWQNAGSDYSQLSLGLKAQSNGMISWLIENDLKYTTQSYLFNVNIGNNIKLSQGHIFSLLLVNGSNSGLKAVSPLFTIATASSSSTKKATPKTTTTSSKRTTSTTSASSTSASTLPETSSTSSIESTTSAEPVEPSEPTDAASTTDDTPQAIEATPTPSISSAPTTKDTSATSSGLSTGAKAGLGVGIFVGVALLIVAAALVFRSRRKAKDRDDDNLTYPLQPSAGKQDYSGEVSPPEEPDQPPAPVYQSPAPVYQPYRKSQLPHEVHEISSTQKIPGLHELPAGY
ncbi:uncharacterized protein BP5553_05371 [Venustampulla echinocandica]|uniref:Mid2 domain-containing protein n=1 Tax=Venustampulla echinocandica TaxID=2656787 RepID=A0A370TR05_9HELO|nr:uncharacterized protein BP5553_05371 [Venustampulla echinocandica]RDL37938.1 hypothetical protein BP5553_05371 [Venustampulla echinocandica]